MANFELIELLQQDINDLNGVLNYSKNGLNINQAMTVLKGIVGNIQDHVNDLIHSS